MVGRKKVIGSTLTTKETQSLQQEAGLLYAVVAVQKNTDTTVSQASGTQVLYI